MAETFHFDEVLIRQVSGITESRIDVCCKNADIYLRKTYVEMKDERGRIIKRGESGREAEMSLGVVYASEINIADGNNIKIYFANNLGTTSYIMGSCYVTEKGWRMPEDDSITHDVRIVGSDFGTTT